MLPLLAGAILSGVGSAFSNAQSAREAQNARNQNFILNEWAAANADQRARALYQDLQSPQALLEQYREAGLSPSLMLGNGGGVSGHLQQGQQGAGAAGPQTQMFGYDLLTGAQAALALAQADKAKAETETIQGNNQRGQAEISKLFADAGAANAAAHASEAQAYGQELQNYLQNKTMQYDIYRIAKLAEMQGYEAEKAYEEARHEKILTDLDEETFNTEIQRREKEVELLVQNIRVGKSQVRLNNQNAKYLKDLILHNIEETKIRYMEAEAKQTEAEAKAKEVTSYTEYINAQIPVIQKQIEMRLKELGVEKWKVATDAIVGMFKAMALGAAAAAQFSKNNGGNPMSGVGNPTYGEPAQPFN